MPKHIAAKQRFPYWNKSFGRLRRARAASENEVPTSSNPQRAPQSAFTLLEVLLAVTITGFVLAAASTMLVSVTNIWSSRLDSNFFEDHVDGVTEFLQASLREAGLEVSRGGEASAPPPPGDQPNGPVPDNANLQPEVSIQLNTGSRTTARPRAGDRSESGSSSLMRLSEEPIIWAEPPGFAGYRDPLLNFRLRQPPPLLVAADNAPTTGISAFIHFDRDEGLSLLWYSSLQEEVENENDLRRTLVSPYLSEMRYIYWDERFERWEEEDRPQQGDGDQYLLPRFIRLIFERDEIIKERTIAVPVPSRSVMLF